MPHMQRVHFAKALRARNSTNRSAKILHAWRTYASDCALKQARTRRATQHRVLYVMMHACHAWQQHVRSKKHKRAMAEYATFHSTRVVLRRAWLAWHCCVGDEKNKKEDLRSAAMHRHQVIALQCLRGFTETLHKRCITNLATTHSMVTKKRCEAGALYDSGNSCFGPLWHSSSRQSPVFCKFAFLKTNIWPEAS
jgi:hypothetical protein